MNCFNPSFAINLRPPVMVQFCCSFVLHSIKKYKIRKYADETDCSQTGSTATLRTGLLASGYLQKKLGLPFQNKNVGNAFK